MADIRLVKPQANAVHNVPCATGNRFVLDFPSDAALFAKDGDDLVLSFEDGSSIRLQDFYTTYSKEEMPSFEMEGAEISGEDFFAALGNPDLMPAAGPSAGAATRGGGFNQYGNVELLQGIDRLGGLDISFNWGQEHEDDLYAYGHRDIDYGVSVVPVVPGILDPDIPVVDDPDNPNDGGVGPVVDRLEVWEEGLAIGSNPEGEDVPTVAHGGMDISAPDGVATIVIGKVTVFANGHLVRGSDGAPVKVETGEGYLQVTGFNPATGRLEYTYTLTDSTQEHDQGEANEHFTHLLPVTVTDSDGDRGSSTISVVIRDDEPDANDDANTMEEGANETYQCSGNVITGLCDGEEIAGSADIQGADGASLTAVVSVNTPDASAENVDGALKIRGEYGTLTIRPDGSYTYVVDRENYNKAIMGLKDGESLKDVFSYTLTDRDGDPADAYLTISINGTSHDNIPEFSGKVTVDEADLTADSNNGHEGNAPGIEGVGSATTGSFTLKVMDGLASMKIDGNEVKLTLNDDGTVTLEPGQRFSDSNGYLTIDSIAGVGKYEVTYTYHLTTSTLEHAAGADRNHLAEGKFHSFEVTVSDQDESSQSGFIRVDIIDDIPELVGEPDFTENPVQVSEEALQASGTGLATATVNLAAAFANVQEQYGADGPNQADAAREKGVYTLELSANRVATNLEGLVGDGEGAGAYAQIFLVKTADGVQGVAGDDNTPCFTISLDEKGNATFTLLQPVRHGAENTKTDDSLTLETVDGGSFTVKYTITDADGDTASASLDLGKEGVFTIEDSETGVQAADKDSPNTSLTVDESFANGDEDRFADGVQSEPDEIGKTAVLDKEYVQGLFEIHSGADDTGLTGMDVAHKFSLIISGGANSGLTGLYEDKNGATQSGTIFLFKNEEDGSIYGRVGGKDGPEAFKLEIDDQTGEITLTMTGPASIGHDNKDKFDETATLAGKIQVELTVTDRDGDSNSDTANVTLNFQDDGPALSMPDSAREVHSKAQVADDGTITGHLSGEMQFDFGADGPAKNGAVKVEIFYGEEGEPIAITCTYDATTKSWNGQNGDHVFTIKPKGDSSSDDLYIFEYTRPVSINETSDGDVTIKVTVTDGDGDSIFQQTTDYAPTITVEDQDDKAAVKEAGVAGHNRDPKDPLNPNAEVSGKPSVSGKITLAQSSDDDKADDDNLSLILYGGSIKHTTLTLDNPDDHADQEGEPITSEVGNFGKIDEEKGGSFYLVQNDEKLALKESVSEGEDYYGTLTFTKDGGNTWTWQFTLNDNETSKLVNSMTEKEEIHLSLNLGVSDGMLQDGSGKLDITIHGTNDLPVFAQGIDDHNVAGKNLVTDDGGVSGAANSITGTLKATDPDTDNGGQGITDQGENHLSFSLAGFEESKVGTVGEDGKYTPYEVSDAADAAHRIDNLQSDGKDQEVVEKGDGSTSITTKYGTLTVQPDGTFTYEPGDTSAIGKGEYVTETFTVRVTDAHGSWTEKQITITLRDGDASVTGHKVTLNAKEEGVVGNDMDLFKGDHNASVSTQDGEPDAGKGTVLFTDNDLNDTLTLTSNNSLLTWNETPYQVEFPEKIEVGIAGTSTVLYLVAYKENEKWFFAWTESKQGNQDIVGTLTLERTDTGEVKASFDLDPQNTTEEESNNSGFLDQLEQGDPVTVELPLQATSSGGDKTADSKLTINIEGTNDKPVIDSVKGKNDQPLSNKAEEYTYPTESEDSEGSGESSGASEPDLVGFVTAHDVDRDNGSGQPTTAVDGHGLVFTLNKDFECNTSGSSQIEESTFQGEGSFAFVQENHAGNFDNQYTTIKTTYGTLEIKSDTGEFTYTLDKPERDAEGKPNPIMELGEGQSVTETYTVRVTDSHGSWTESEIKITIEGTNDRPVITTQGLEVHGAEENTPDSAYYHPETHPEDHSTAQVVAKDYDLDDTYSYLFVDGDKASTEPIEITAGQLLAALQEPAQERFDGDPNALLVLKAYLELNPNETVATLNLAGDGTLTLIPNQQSDFVQALNATDSVKFSLSDVTGYKVAAKDSHDAFSDSVDVTLVLHGTDDTNAATSVIVPHGKEEGVYRNEENAIQETVTLSESAVEPGYGTDLASAEGSFTVHDRDAGQIVFKTKDGEVIGEETGTQFGENGEPITFETGEDSMYVLGEYGYYIIQLDSVMAPDTGSKTFEYTYNLYSENAPQDVIDQLGDNLDDKLELVDSIPQGEKVQDPVTIKVDTGGKEEADLTLSATVSGSNDKPYIDKVLSYNDTSEEGYMSLDVVSETQPDEPGTSSSMYFDKENGTLQITLQSNSNGSSGKYIGQILGLDPDRPLEEDGKADGTTVVNYAFVYTKDGDDTASNVWSIDGSEATSKYGIISIDAKGVIRIELNKDAGKDISQGEWEEFFAGLGVRCIDDLGATSEVVRLSGKLVGVDDEATAIASNESLWEGKHDADFAHSQKPYEGEEKPVLADSEHKLIGSIKVTDPDKDDVIGSDVTVTIGEIEYTLNLSEGAIGTVPGEYGYFSFSLEYLGEGKNEAILHYTYTYNYTDDPKDLDRLNIDEQDTLEDIKVSFTSGPSGPDENKQTIESGITITAKGTNDAPVIDSVKGIDVSDTAENVYNGGTVPARGQAEGNIEFSDVDNEGETYCGFLTYTASDGTTYYLYGETGEHGNTVYKAWYPSGNADDFDASEITYKDLVLTNLVELKHGTLYVDDQGHYIYSRKPGDTNTDPENVYVTVSDPHGAMDSVEIRFEFGEDGPGDMLPAIDMNEDVTLPVTEPSTDGDRVYAGEEGSFVSSFDEGIRDNFELTLYYTTDDNGNPQLVYRDGQDVFKDSNGDPVEKLLEATGTLVPDEDGGYTWQFQNAEENVINFDDFYLEIRFTDPNEDNSWADGTYSMSTDYGTVYVDRETGEIRYELDSRADALNAGQKVTESVAVWINGHRVTGEFTLEVTGTGDASLVEAPALHVDLDDANHADSGTLQIDDIDNSDTGEKSVNDTHSLEIKLSDGTMLTVEEGGTFIYVVATEEQPGYELVNASDDVDGDSLYGTLTFTVDSEGQYHYTFTPKADSEASKNLKGGATIAFEIPLTVTDTSPKATESEGDYNNPTTSKTDLVITLEGKADEPDISGVFNIGITEEGGIPEDSQGASAGPDSHAVQGKLVIEDYNEGYSISGVSGDESTFENGSTVIEGTYGTLVLKQDGSYTYTLKYDKVQSLQQGQEKEDTFTVKVVNGAGQDAYATIKVDVIGENDQPVVTVTPVLSVQEQHGTDQSVSGKVEAQDIDKGDTLTYGIMADDRTFVTPTGEEQEASVYVYAAENGGDFVFLTQNNGNPSLLVGTLTMGQDGIYTFAPADSDYVRALDAGESINFTVPVGAKDPDGDPVTKPVSITIHGSNENPEITTAIEISENEMLQGSSTGSQYTLTINPEQYNYSATDAEDDPDDKDLSYTFERNGEYLTHVETTASAGEKKYNVSLSIDENGKISLSYGDDLRAAIDALGKDEPLQLSFGLNVVVQDGSGGKSPSKLELTVTGDNDAPTDLNASVDEKNGLDGTLSFTDVDATDEHTITFDRLYTSKEHLSSLSIKTDSVPSEAQPVYNEDGNYLGTIEFVWDNSRKTLDYTFNPGQTYLDSLPIGKESNIQFSVMVTDSHGATAKKDGLKFTVVNKNDKPVIDAELSENDDENEGTIVFTDADQLDSHSVVFNGLQDAQNQPLVFDLTDGPSSSQEVFYNSIAVGTLTVSYTTSAEGNKVEYSFVPTTDENALNKLLLGETSLKFSASIRDAHGESSSSITDSLVVTNVNDAPGLDITESDGGFSGTLIITDPDELDKHTITVLFDGNTYDLGADNTVTIPELGTFTFTQEGKSWSYSLDASAIAAGIAVDSHVDKTFQIQVSDTGDNIASTGEIHVTVEGTNKAPTAESPESTVKIEQLGHAVSLELAALARDADGDELTLTITDMDNGQVTGKYGTLSYDAESGSYSYALDTSEENLAALGAAQEDGQSLTESFDYTVSDGVNESVPGSITLNLDLSGLELPLPVEPEETPGEEETTIPDPSQGDSSETDTDEGFKAMVYVIENGEDDTLLFARDTYSLADGEEMYSLSPDDSEENTIDIVAYDSTDYMVDGGEGVSFMVSDNEDLTMDDILQGDGQHGPIVSNIDVLITGEGAESLTNMDQLARDYGISVDRDANALTLDESWQKVDSGQADTQVFSNGSLTLETSLDVSCPSDDLNVQAAMHQVTNN